jgi:hypothetical protein
MFAASAAQFATAIIQTVSSLIQTIANLLIPVLYFPLACIAWAKRNQPTMNGKEVALIDVLLDATVVTALRALSMAMFGDPGRGAGGPGLAAGRAE